MNEPTVDYIDKIISMSKPETIEIEGRQYSRDELFVIKEPTSVALKVLSLTSIADYINSGMELDPKEYFIVVENSAKVNIYSKLNADKNRNWFLGAYCEGSGTMFREYCSIEEFIIWTQIHIEDTDNRQRLLDVVSKMTDAVLKTESDNGISQMVSVKSGIQELEIKELPNPVKLLVNVSFPEIPPMEISYVFRARKSPNGIQVALFDMVPERWNLQAVKEIKSWLKLNIPEEWTII